MPPALVCNVFMIFFSFLLVSLLFRTTAIKKEAERKVIYFWALQFSASDG